VKRALVPVGLPPERLDAGSPRHTERTLLRYRPIEAVPRQFARWKIRLDPMFRRLASFAKSPRRILDVGCGYGIPSAWLLELFPEAEVYGLDPARERIRVAESVFGPRGKAHVGRAPDDLDWLRGEADTALVLDIIHMLDDEALQRTLGTLFGKLIPGGRLILRATVPQSGRTPWMRRLEALRLKRHGMSPHYRGRDGMETMLRAAGFQVETVETASPGSEEYWFIADRPGGSSIRGAP